MRFEVNTEFGLVWRFPLSMVIAEQFTLLEFTPILHLDLNAWASAEIHLWFINMRFTFNVMPYAFTPFDVTVRVDPVEPSRWCHGADYYGNALVFSVDYEQEVNECIWGLFGQIYPDHDTTDCWWRYYKPELPLFETQISEYVDFLGEYYNYRCMNWHSASWGDTWPLSAEDIAAAEEIYALKNTF